MFCKFFLNKSSQIFSNLALVMVELKSIPSNKLSHSIAAVDDDDNVDDAVISRMAREEWLDILDGGQESYYQSTNTRVDDDVEQSYEHPLWKDVSAPYRSVRVTVLLLVHFYCLHM